MTGGFEGDVAGYYARYRRGYPPAVVDAVAEALALTPADTIVDLGCGTAQLTLPLPRNDPIMQLRECLCAPPYGP